MTRGWAEVRRPLAVVGWHGGAPSSRARRSSAARERRLGSGTSQRVAAQPWSPPPYQLLSRLSPRRTNHLRRPPAGLAPDRSSSTYPRRTLAVAASRPRMTTGITLSLLDRAAPHARPAAADIQQRHPDRRPSLVCARSIWAICASSQRYPSCIAHLIGRAPIHDSASPIKQAARTPKMENSPVPSPRIRIAPIGF
jgi:hypothetical protein